MQLIKKTTFLASLASLALVLPGCDAVQRKPHLTETFGNSVKHNMAVQIVNPEASASITEPPGMDGIRANRAVTLYHTGTTTRIVKEKTSSGGGGK